jgi:hypothetical protein
LPGSRYAKAVSGLMSMISEEMPRVASDEEWLKSPKDRNHLTLLTQTFR